MLGRVGLVGQTLVLPPVLLGMLGRVRGVLCVLRGVCLRVLAV